MFAIGRKFYLPDWILSGIWENLGELSKDLGNFCKWKKLWIKQSSFFPYCWGSLLSNQF